MIQAIYLVAFFEKGYEFTYLSVVCFIQLEYPMCRVYLILHLYRLVSLFKVQFLVQRESSSMSKDLKY